MKRVITRILLLIYGLAIIHIGMLDLGHTLLHAIKSSMHEHAHGHHHAMHDHQPLMKVTSAHHGDATSDTGTELSGYFLFFEAMTGYQINPRLHKVQWVSRWIGDAHSGYKVIIPPPPLS